MATYSTGISVTWGGAAFTEVFGISWSWGGARLGRSINWIADPGSVTVSCYGATNVSTAEHGLRKALVITGGGSAFNGYGICESVAVAPELNGVTKYTVTFKIHN
jgi:hypothetical protein